MPKSKYRAIICPMCLDLARAQQFNEIPVCDAPILDCADCPVDWSKLVKK